jgi:hypothetical protein
MLSAVPIDHVLRSYSVVSESPSLPFRTDILAATARAPRSSHVCGTHWDRCDSKCEEAVVLEKGKKVVFLYAKQSAVFKSPAKRLSVLMFLLKSSTP